MTPDVVPYDLPDVVESWREAVEALTVNADELAAAGETGMLAYALDRTRELRRVLGDLERHVEAHVADLMAHKVETVDGLGTLERRTGTDRKQWQSADLLHDIVVKSVTKAVDEDTGEIPSATELVALVVDDIESAAPFTGSMGWRVTALRALGFDPDEYATVTPGRVSVQIHKADTP